MEKIKIKNKYYLFKYNVEKQKIKKILEANKMSELKENIVGKSIDSSNEILLLKLSKEKKFNIQPNQSGLNKLVGGPIKIIFKVYEINDSNVLKPKYEKIKNKKGELDSDKRNSQFLYITMDYYLSGIKTNDLELVALLAIQNKLEKRPLAPKLINQIDKLK